MPIQPRTPGARPEKNTYGRGVYKGILKVGVARQKLRLQELGIGDVLEEGGEDAVRRRDMFELEGFESHGASCGLRGFNGRRCGPYPGEEDGQKASHRRSRQENAVTMLSRDGIW
jgi:hypothetical protein